MQSVGKLWLVSAHPWLHKIIKVHSFKSWINAQNFRYPVFEVTRIFSEKKI